MMENSNNILVIFIVIGLAIALPWFLYVAVDKNQRSQAGNVWQKSMEAVQKTLRGENKDIEELNKRVQKFEEEKKKEDKQE
jgi:predicted negative regulator of RcsB-dependent stress response